MNGFSVPVFEFILSVDLSDDHHVGFDVMAYDETSTPQMIYAPPQDHRYGVNFIDSGILNYKKGSLVDQDFSWTGAGCAGPANW